MIQNGVVVNQKSYHFSYTLLFNKSLKEFFSYISFLII